MKACWPQWIIWGSFNLTVNNWKIFSYCLSECDYKSRKSNSFEVFKSSNVIAERSPKGIYLLQTLFAFIVYQHTGIFPLLAHFNPASIGKKLRSNSTEFSHLHSCLAGGQFFECWKIQFLMKHRLWCAACCCCRSSPELSSIYLFDRHCRSYSEF